MAWLIPVGALLGIVLLLLWRRRKPKSNIYSHIEYWIYVDKPELPKQETLMDRMISSNPHNKRGRPCIGAREGMLFSDIRLHVATARRSKNPHIFRPDLFESYIEPTASILEALALSQAIVKVRYASDIPLKDDRHLQFMPHMADAMAELTGGKVIFDSEAEKLYSASEFHELLTNDPNAARTELHIRVVWIPSETGGHGRLLGLRKVGLPIIETDEAMHDQKVLITSLLEEAGRRLLKDPTLPESMEIDLFEDVFVLSFREEEGKVLASVTRRQQID